MADLKKRIADILKDSDFKTATAKKVRNQLEEDTGLDISLKIEEISRIMQEVMDETTEEKEVLESGEEGSEEAKATPEKESFSPLYMSSPKKLQLVSLDVGGKIFKTKMETLTKYPDSALARMFTDPLIEETLTKTENGEYFLDVDPEDFEVILKFLRLGKVSSENLTEDVLVLADFFGFKSEMESNVVEPSTNSQLERFNGNQQNFTTAAMVLSDGPENQGEKVKIIMFSFSGNNRQFRNQQSAASMSQVMFSFMKQALQNQKMENN